MNLEDKIKECNELYEKCDFEALIGKCDKILGQCPDNPNAMGYKGFSLYALGRDGEAMEILKKGVELYPDNYYLKNNLAMVYYGLGDYETSLKLCEEGLEIREFDWLFENKFKNLIKLARFDEAIDFERANSNHLFAPAVFLAEDMRPHELDYYRHVLKRNPDDLEALEMIRMIEGND